MPSCDRIPHSSYRPLLPASHCESQTAQPQSRRRRRGVVHNACEACQFHKAKCNGRQPCTRCVTRHSTCVFPGRTSERTLQELQHYKTALGNIFDSLRLSAASHSKIDMERIASESEDVHDFMQRVSEMSRLLQKEVQLPGRPHEISASPKVDESEAVDIPPCLTPSSSFSRAQSTETLAYIHATADNENGHPNMEFKREALAVQPAFMRARLPDSVQDMLPLEDVKLPFDFRFSLLPD